MKKSSLVWILLLATFTMPAFAWGDSKNNCDYINDSKLKKECWVIEGKSDFQDNMEEETIELQRKRKKKAEKARIKREKEAAKIKKKAQKKREKREKEARKRRQKRDKEQAKINKEKSAREAKLKRKTIQQKEIAEQLREGRVIKTFFYDDLKYLGKFPYIARGIRNAKIIINGERYVNEELLESNDLCVLLNYDGELESTKAQKSDFYKSVTMENVHKRKHRTAVVGVVSKDERNSFFRVDDNAHFEVSVFMRVTCYRYRTNLNEDQTFDDADYQRELDKSSTSYNEHTKTKKQEQRKSKNNRPRKTRTYDSSKFTNSGV